MSGKSPADRVKAHRLRSKQANPATAEVLTDDEAAFLDSYEESKVAKNRSQSAERIVHIEERAAEAEGDHPHPEAYAAIARSEGLRADTLLRIASEALIKACDQHMRIAEHLLARTTAIETAHVAMLDVVREHYIGRVQAEGERIIAEAESEAAAMKAIDDEDSELMQMLKLLAPAIAAHKVRVGKKTSPKKVKDKKPLGSID